MTSDFDALLDTIYRRYHYDFRAYAEASLQRRLHAAINHLRCATLSDLSTRIDGEPALFTELLRFLTVQVSDMFRDPIYFRTLREHVVPYLQTFASLKVWVAGCATGEEAYSLAILLSEAGLLERTLIYATDITPEGLRVAQDGVYDTQRMQRFSENYLDSGGRGSLADYYAASYGGAVFDRSLKKSIVFSDHSLATDSTFAECELVSCRNVLIYFAKPLQERALGVLAESVRRRGFLGLGIKETLRFTMQAPRFTELVPDTRLYRKL
jgi:chemotaxis protein methyltransferase CheR